MEQLTKQTTNNLRKPAYSFQPGSNHQKVKIGHNKHTCHTKSNTQCMTSKYPISLLTHLLLVILILATPVLLLKYISTPVMIVKRKSITLGK